MERRNQISLKCKTIRKHKKFLKRWQCLPKQFWFDKRVCVTARHPSPCQIHLFSGFKNKKSLPRDNTISIRYLIIINNLPYRNLCLTGNLFQCVSSFHYIDQKSHPRGEAYASPRGIITCIFSFDFLYNQHGVSEGKEPVSLSYRFLICREYMLSPRQRGHKHNKGGFWQMKIRNQSV